MLDGDEEVANGYKRIALADEPAALDTSLALTVRFRLP